MLAAGSLWKTVPRAHTPTNSNLVADGHLEVIPTAQNRKLASIDSKYII